MSVPENKSAWMTDTVNSNVSLVDFKFEMPDHIFGLYVLYLTGSMAIGIPGNFIVLAIYQKLKPSTNIDCYIVSISVLDIACLVVTVPMYIVIHTKLWDVTDANTLCKVLNFTVQLVTFSESFLLCAMAIERFLKVCRPNLTSSLDGRGKYIVSTIILSTIFISFPNLIFSWVDYQRSCFPLTNPPWIASAFFIVTISLFIVMFGIVSFSYTSVVKTLFFSAQDSTNKSIAFRKIKGRNKITPLSYQMDLRPTTTYSLKRTRNETSTPVHGDVRNIQIHVTQSSSKLLLTVEAACLGKEHFHRDIDNSDIKKNIENYGKDLALQGNTYTKSETGSSICVPDISQAGHMAIKRRQKVVREIFENMSLSQKKRFLRTTKISFLITVTFIISWLPVWIYTFLTFFELFKDPYAGLFLRKAFFINTFMNPILYLTCNRHFRNKVKGLFFKNRPTFTS
ncbi:hypothetical protein ACJMK2_018644 [Sinanodonta woodiana]|uniref:G-protein coupled receptors family 1 profile domain-containing protein n=1 Tax=Sinanodonta woodiana TaxID=1069815 RepID=A0ABD3UHG1_SINWO